ncbi:MAG TPA: RNA-binding protein [Gammaproteobacteria bacterium]|nr:RNA-binding protein [Gammaproteobacteria bacterium]
MIVFIGNLPAGISERDLQLLVQPPGGAPVRIVKKRNRNGNLYRYGLVHARSERDAMKVIRRVHGKVWMGAQLVSREYGPRRVSNERRRLDWRMIPWTDMERRLSERRNSEGW